ncbi:MAG: hypothetical protein GX640_15040 [Fibrobacter sp.]|nr:hypothetical protein [Fibrobacter sp.]
MNFFRKLKLTLNANLEGLVDKIENHEAVAESLIREVKKKAAKLRIELNRIRSDSSRLNSRIGELCKDEQLWRERASKTYSTDRPKALECASSC